MDKLAILPLFGAIYLLSKGRDARNVFVVYFLPVLTLIPAYYETKLISGIPEFTFWSSALIPIAIVWIFNEKMEGYNFSWIDVILILHVSFLFYAQFDATGYKDAQKIVFREILNKVLPYLFIKAVMLEPNRRTPVFIVITVLGAIVSVSMLYEAKFYYNHLDVHIRKIWPFDVPWGGTLQRYGLKRAAGSFAHPISAGYFFAMSAPLAFYLWREKIFKKDIHGLLVFGLNVLGVVTSISRAPIAGFLFTLILIWFGWSKSKSVSGGILILIGIVGLSVAIPKFVEYVSIKRSHAKTQDQENAAYRKEMLDNYIEVIEKKPVWGYGRYTFPVVKGQKSIDNEYLFIAITSGMLNVVVYVAFILAVFIRLLLFSLKQPSSSREGKLGWVLLGIWMSAILTQLTVYSGMQTTNYFFMIAAIVESLIQNSGLYLVNTASTEPMKFEEDRYAYHFSRTL